MLASIQTAFYKPPSHCTIPKHTDAEVIYRRHNKSPPLDNTETHTLVVASNCLDFIVFKYSALWNLCLAVTSWMKRYLSFKRWFKKSSAGWLIITCLYFQDEVFRLSLDASLETLSLLLGTQLLEDLWKVHPSSSPYPFRNSLQTHFTLDLKLIIVYSCREFYFEHFSPISIIFICIFLFYFCKKLFPGNKVRYPSWYKISDNSGFSIGCHIHVQNLTLIIPMSLPDFSFMFFQFIFTEIVCQPLSRCIQIPPLFRMSQWMVSSCAAFHPIQFPSIVLFFPVFASQLRDRSW